jgi:ribosomal protein S18 acetylase RimI-like enzyme
MVIRAATEADREVIGFLAGELVRFHHGLDSERFLSGDGVDQGYGRWLLKEARSERARVFVSENNDGSIDGYVYGTLEAHDWYELLGAHGKLHDVFVREGARNRGVARALVLKMIEELESMGAPRIVLSTAVKNEAAQRLFASLGFAPSMIEMTRRSSR